MLVSTLVGNIQNTLADKGVYRPDSFILTSINEGYRMVAVLSMFDERRGSVTVTGSRNMVGLPTGMLVPLYVGNQSTGRRVHPVRLNELELYSGEWEGKVDGSEVEYYSLLNPHHPAEVELWCVPVPTGGSVELDVVGVHVPDELGSGDRPRLDEAFQDLLYLYGVFSGFVSEPHRAEDAGREYGKFVGRLNSLIAEVKSRFPSGYLFLPQQVEFSYAGVTRQQQKIRPPKEETPQEGADES